jgi:hypothetical protein
MTARRRVWEEQKKIKFGRKVRPKQEGIMPRVLNGKGM